MKIGVIGLGLIGGSIFKKLKDLGANVIGISRTVKSDSVFQEYENLCGCELVFVCTPMNTVLNILDKLELYLDKNTIVTDVSSLKEFVSKKKYKYKFIPSHPMAGTEHSGWESSFAELFENATWAVTLKEDTQIKDFELLKSVIEKLGARTIMTTPKEHDIAVAMISHAPMVVAQALCKNIVDNELAKNLASSGFRDTTRLALSNTEMANDMVLMNSDNIKDVLDLLNKNLVSIMSGNYKHQAEEIKDFREKLYSC